LHKAFSQDDPGEAFVSMPTHFSLAISREQEEGTVQTHGKPFEIPALRLQTPYYSNQTR
jgi:hypothetical protein